MGENLVFKDRSEQRRVLETMISLLSPLKTHCNEVTKESIEITLWVLQNIPVGGKDEEKRS